MLPAIFIGDPCYTMDRMNTLVTSMRPSGKPSPVSKQPATGEPGSLPSRWHNLALRDWQRGHNHWQPLPLQGPGRLGIAGGPAEPPSPAVTVVT